jgi:ABC-2 type transport system ATP-binding protein
MILEIENVVKQFESVTALNNVNFSIEKGRIFGLLGPNGAGKTTLIRIITQIFKPDKGQILFNGNKIDISNIKDIGYLPEERGLYPNMKVGEQLVYLASLKGIPQKVIKQNMMELFMKFGIENWLDKKPSELSKGMQQKIQFILTILHKPKLIILDEPFTGLDPINTNLIKKEIREMSEKGITIIFSTHRMEQVEEICEDIVLINKGQVLLAGKVEEVKHKFKNNHFLVKYKGEIPKNILESFEVILHKNNKIIVKDDSPKNNDLLSKLLPYIEITTFKEVLPTLNEIFINQVKGVSDE